MGVTFYGFLAWLNRLPHLHLISVFPVLQLDCPACPVVRFHAAPYPRLLLSDSPTQGSQVRVAVQILDVNDNPPQLEQSYEPFACDNAVPGQVS